MATLYDKIYGCIAGSRVASAMAVATEGWSYQEIEERWGRMTDFASQEEFEASQAARAAARAADVNGRKRQPLPTLWRQPESQWVPGERRIGMTEDGIERQKILAACIIENKGRMTVEDWAEYVKARIRRDQHFGYLLWIGDEYIYPMVQGEVDPCYTGMFFPWPEGHGFARGSQPLGIINAGNPWQASRDALDVGMLLYPRYGTGIWSAACYTAAIAEAMKADATIDSVIAAAKQYGGHSMATWIDRVMDVAAGYDDIFALRNDIASWFQGWTMCGEENVSLALAIFAVTKADLQASIIAGVNWGRDTDCIAAMASGLSGALNGRSNLPQKWIDLVERETRRSRQTICHRTMEEASRGLLEAIRGNATALHAQIASLQL